MKNEMPTARIIISDDGLLDAYPVDRELPSFLNRDVFNNTVRNKKPVIIDGAALRWLGMSEEGATPEFDMEILEECDVEMLIAFDGRNFLRNSLCSTKSVNLKTGMRSILERNSGDFLTDCLQERAYIRIYFDCHRRLLEKVDLSYLTRLASFTSLVDVISEIQSDVKLKSTFDDNFLPFKLKNIGLWTSSEGCVTPLHFDRCHGFLAQIIGTKTFLIASCCDSVLLRYWRERGQINNENGSTSPINLLLWLEGNAKERLKYPLVDEVAWFIAKLLPGDILYTPPGWWHYVISNTASMSVLLPFDPLPSSETLPTNVLLS
jgi:Cupin-like domain